MSPRWPIFATSPLFVAFLAGELDAVLSLITPQRAHDLVPRSHLEVVPGGPHSMYWETPDAFNAAVARLREKQSAKVMAS